MNYWLVKSEPSKYSWEQFLKDGRTTWDGVRNYAARLHLRAMKKGDLVLFYHSNEGTHIAGIAKVAKEAYQDPTTTEDWSAVDLIPYKKLNKPVTLQQLKNDRRFSEMALIKIGRLSVSPVKEHEFDAILALGS